MNNETTDPYESYGSPHDELDSLAADSVLVFDTRGIQYGKRMFKDQGKLSPEQEAGLEHLTKFIMGKTEGDK